MTFFDTLKDKNLKAIFRELAWNRHGRGDRTISQIVEDMKYDERLELFTLSHKIMKALEIPGWQSPMLLNRDENEYIQGQM